MRRLRNFDRRLSIGSEPNTVPEFDSYGIRSGVLSSGVPREPGMSPSNSALKLSYDYVILKAKV